MSKFSKNYFYGIAPESLVKKDFSHLIENDKLDTDETISRFILLQSIEGHAHNGDSTFQKQRFVNTTTHDVVKALHLDVLNVKTKRQELIENIFDFVKECCLGKKTKSALVDAHGRPLLGIPWFENTEVSIPDLLRGIYIGGRRDDPDVRKFAEKKYGIKIGGGKCYFVNINVMEKMGLDGEMLAHGDHEKFLDEYRIKGLISENLKMPDLEEREYKYMYIRHRQGPGTSDDGSMVGAGLIYNIDTALGVFLADAVDTLDKYVLEYKDWDYEISSYIKDYYPGFDTKEDEIYSILYICTAPESGGKFKAIPDSSLRYFLLIDPKTGRTGLQNHIAFLKGKPFSGVLISHGKYDSREFYSHIKARISQLNLSMVTPETILLKLNKKVGDFVVPLEKCPGCIMVTPEDSLGDAIRKMQKEKGKFLVVIDNGKVTGIIQDEELLHLVV